jgi:antitoxin component of RelBE/YafQ-DinJ toxin-antitoxin module
MTTLTIRVEDSVKEQAEAAFAHWGYTLAAGVNAFLRQLAAKKETAYDLPGTVDFSTQFAEHQSASLKKIWDNPKEDEVWAFL